MKLKIMKGKLDLKKKSQPKTKLEIKIESQLVSQCGSVFCITQYTLPTMCGHAPNDSVRGVLVDLPQDQDQGINEVLKKSVVLTATFGCTIRSQRFSV